MTSELQIAEKESPEAQSYLDLASRLEAVGSVVHGSAYQPTMAACKVFRRLGQYVSYPQAIQKTEVVELAARLHYMSNTVASNLGKVMKEAADLLEKLAQ